MKTIMKKLIITLIISLVASVSAYAAPFGVSSDNNDYLGFAPWAEGYRLNIAEFDIKNISIAPYAPFNNSYNATGISGVVNIDMSNAQTLELNTSVLNLATLNHRYGLGLGLEANYKLSLPGTDAHGVSLSQ
jgi:hypothetical protein